MILEKRAAKFTEIDPVTQYYPPRQPDGKKNVKIKKPEFRIVRIGSPVSIFYSLSYKKSIKFSFR